jgi:dTDP-4-amino-4,6-dideoxygalactose transaminase
MTAKASRIFLSPPHMSGAEMGFIRQAFAENYITTAGSNVGHFEQELCRLTGSAYAVALNSGTAAIHLALRVLGLQAGEEVLCSTFTFIATANPILYEKAVPIFIDSEPGTWNMCPRALETAIGDRLRQGRKPRAIILVHLYGMPARLTEILQIAGNYQIPVIEDAAEALGASYQGRPLGSFGDLGIISFNGNKIITTSGGGMLTAQQQSHAQKALFLASQAKDPAPYYLHSELGYNYRLSNVSAGIGLGQLTVLGERVGQRRAVFAYYRQALQHLPALSFPEELPGSFSNRWLSCLLVAPGQGPGPEALRLALEKENIEARPLWKPLHQQPLYAHCPYYGADVAESLFRQGLCLPSGSALTTTDLDRIVRVIKDQFTL